MTLRVLSAADVVRALPMADAIEAVKQGFVSLSTGQAVSPVRTRVDLPAHAGMTLVMPSHLPGSTKKGEALAVKIVSVFPGNSAEGLPTIHAGVLVLDPETGRVLAVMEGAALTAIRTGAASGAATDALARTNSRVAAIFGSGVQARTQLEAVCTVRKLERVWVYSPNPAHARAFAEAMAGRGPIPADMRVAATPKQAVAESDIVCAATTASAPVFDGRDVRPGTHVNGVGSFTLGMREVDAETVRRSLVVVDSREAMAAEAGDIVIPLREGQVPADHVHAEIGEIIAGRKLGRTSESQITFFKSVGVAVQDAASARRALENAERLDLGTVVAF